MNPHEQLLADIDAWLQSIRGEAWNSPGLLAIRVEAWLLRFHGGAAWAVTPSRSPEGGHVRIWIDALGSAPPTVRHLMIRNGRVDVPLETFSA
ncbi:hypothetical protein GobsT_48220 [Gemmata obscuriglobus]|uniref:Uncharacterized protein n=1 Tax=Gemmata obscuriglobus TaxID=114 RepID=A0A2Z3H6F5_9BACT|nr:hypothetical protein [Gemmata obscuriglobus]AWM37234.1 hypothetical protein C1280_09495 [Gemmata obscuriglobus]QEG30022.1 hypothetical protein GobsT_48220 [Gemmata obscuriglobus]VTS09343.1 unnamed protein product [Gemmata obscuriglobus UQM 2246]